MWLAWLALLAAAWLATAARAHRESRSAPAAHRVTVSEIRVRPAARVPAVRSVDIQPAAELVPRNRSARRPVLARDESAANPITNANATTNMNMNPTTTTERPRAWRRWKASGSTLLLLLLTTALAVSGNVSATEAAAGYIVLVGVPALDRVEPLKNLAQELLQRGFHVGFALPEHCRYWISDVEQLEFISLGELATRPMPEFDAAAVYESYAATLRRYAALQRPMFHALIDDFEEDRPDLVVLDRYAFAAVDACQKMNVPFVVHSPTLLLDMDAPPAYVPAPFSTYTTHNPSVLARCKNSFERLRFRLATVQVFREINLVRQENGLPPIESKDDAFGHQLVLVSSAFGLDEPRPISPQFQLVGMLERTKPSQKTLSNDLASWLAIDSVKPVVFISFLSDSPLSPEFVTELLHGLEGVGARLVWKITLQEQAAFDLRSRARDSVFFAKDDEDESHVLQLAPVSLLITAGSHFSVLQAVTLGVPVLGIPLSAEQWETMNMIERTGSGILLPKSDLSEAHVYDAAMALLHDSHYARSAFRLGEIVRTGGGTKRAADQVQSVFEFGVGHILPARNLQPLYKTYLVDVYLVYGLILFCSAILLRSFFSALYHVLQLAPDVHLGVTLDEEGEDPQNGTDGGHHDVQKPSQGHHHHHHHHGNHHHGHGHTHHSKEKEL